MAELAVLFDRRQNIGIITLNRPDRLNAINLDLLVELITKLDAARQNVDVACVIMTGAGKAFCAGEDLKETSAGKSIEVWELEVYALQEVQRAIMRLGKPLIAAVHGYAVGGGCEFAMSCDIRIASQGARFGFPETDVGMTVTTAGTKLLSHLVGLGKAKELVFTGEFIDAVEAARIGLVNRVVAEERLMEEAMDVAQKIALRSPLALRLSRSAIEQGLNASFEQALQLEASQLLACVGDGSYLKYVDKKIVEMTQS